MMTRVLSTAAFHGRRLWANVGTHKGCCDTGDTLMTAEEHYSSIKPEFNRTRPRGRRTQPRGHETSTAHAQTDHVVAKRQMHMRSTTTWSLNVARLIF